MNYLHLTIIMYYCPSLVKYSFIIVWNISNYSPEFIEFCGILETLIYLLLLSILLSILLFICFLLNCLFGLFLYKWLINNNKWVVLFRLINLCLYLLSNFFRQNIIFIFFFFSFLFLFLYIFLL